MPRVLPSWALSQRVGSFVSRGGSLVSARAGEATRIAAAQAVQTDPLAALRRSAAASLAPRSPGGGSLLLLVTPPAAGDGHHPGVPRSPHHPCRQSHLVRSQSFSSARGRRLESSWCAL